AVEPFETLPGEQVTIRAVCRGDLQPETVRWHLGDGTVAAGREVTHSYAEAYDYPIRVRVTGADGAVHRGSGYVVVAEPRDSSEPLVRTTWERDDERAWWLWKSYRPFPARYERRVDDETGRAYRHIYAPEDGGRLPAQIHPRDWDIDAYPRVFIRYRVGEGVPIAVTLHAFAGPGGVIAASPAAEVAEDERLADNMLVDDEQWHEIEIDVRAIRDVNPDVTMLEGMRIGAAPADAVDEGEWYDLDEVIIGPETAD
ncbi:MAG: PKD domain-containing protein, partial [Armatimonadota bacterium]